MEGTPVRVSSLQPFGRQGVEIPRYKNMLKNQKKVKEIGKHMDLHQQCIITKSRQCFSATLHKIKKQKILFSYSFLQLLTLTSCL
jgi:hypothetical protein